MPNPANWTDLAPRLGAAAIMVAMAVLAVWQGGALLALLVGVAAAIMLWEIGHLLSGAGVSGPARLGGLVVAAAVLGFAAFYIFALLEGGPTAGPWPEWILGVWLVVVVMATDVAGYFGGKMIGGPKVWPRLSPKKTWSGVISGWLAALIVAGGIAVLAGLPHGGKWLAAGVIVSLFSQAGDFAESALKRRLGAKDSSQILPGHGGLCDRFDGLVGGVFGLILAAKLLGLPELYQ